MSSRINEALRAAPTEITTQHRENGTNGGETAAISNEPTLDTSAAPNGAAPKPSSGMPTPTLNADHIRKTLRLSTTGIRPTSFMAWANGLLPFRAV